MRDDPKKSYAEISLEDTWIVLSLSKQLSKAETTWILKIQIQIQITILQYIVGITIALEICDTRF